MYIFLTGVMCCLYLETSVIYSQAKFDIMYITHVTYFGKVSVYLKEVLLSALTRDFKPICGEKTDCFAV